MTTLESTSHRVPQQASAAFRAISPLLTLCLTSIFIFPADMVLRPVGAVGHVSMLLALVLFGVWLASMLFGLHDPTSHRSPARLGLAALWLVSIAAYVTAPQVTASPMARAAADRWILTLGGMTGIALVIVDAVKSAADLARVVRALTVGASICALVAIYQFLTFTDPLDLVRSVMVGMSENGGNTTFQIRAPFVRVAGSTFSPIELGVVSAMILPFALWRAIFRRGHRRSWMLWVQVGLIGVATVMTISRSAILALFIVAVLFIPSLPRTARRWAMVIAPSCLAAVFLVLPGFVSTIFTAFGAGTSDPSLATRVNNWPRVEAIVAQYPLTGVGPGAYIPETALQILDNQFLNTVVTMGLVGLTGLVIFLLSPLLSSVQVMVSARDPELRCFGGACAAASGVAFACSATFDSFSFPVFVIILSAVVGLCGVAWRLAVESTADHGVQSGTTQGGLPWIR